jgi:hypothetical protein
VRVALTPLSEVDSLTLDNAADISTSVISGNYAYFG